MGVAGSIIINSEEISNTVSILNESSRILESDMKPSIVSDFNALTNAGLFVDGIAKLKEQIDALITNHKVLIGEISKHSAEFEEMEEKLSKTIRRGGSGASGYTSGNSGYSGDSLNPSEINTNQGSNGDAVNSEQLIGKIPEITDKTLNELINFINVNKENDTSLKSLLFDKDKAGVLAILLNKFYNKSNDNTISMEDSTLIQRQLIQRLFSKDMVPSLLASNSILVAKEYLIKVCEENNVTVDKLLLDDSYKNTYSTSLMNLYDGNIEKYNLDNDTVNNFRNYADSVAQSKSITSEELLLKQPELL